jgi:hypothetical protein
MNKLCILILGFTCAIGLNCKRIIDEPSVEVEVKLDQQNAIAEIVTHGLVFKYYLTNDKGEITTNFSEGENFYFNFSIRNGRDDDLFINNDFLSNDFLCGIQSEILLNSQPFKYLGKDKIGSGAHKLSANNEYSLIVPWMDYRESWTSLHCYFSGQKNDSLPKGVYYSTFKQSFCFDLIGEGDRLCTVNLIFKINIKIS